jgi:hypothetical protein
MALIFLTLILLLYVRYQKTKDIKVILHYSGAIAAALFFTYISKVIFVHKPVFIIHLALVLLSWIAVFYYIFKERLILWFLLSPLLTTLFFIVEALFFREHG